MEFCILVFCSLMAGFVTAGRVDDIDSHTDQSLTDANQKHFVAGSSMYNLDTNSVELSGGPNEDHILTVPCKSKANKKYNTVNGKGRDYLCKWDGEYTEPGSKQKMKAVVPDWDCLVERMCREGRQKAYWGGKGFAAQLSGCPGGCGGHCYVYYHATINVIQPLPPKYVFKNTTIGDKIYLYYDRGDAEFRRHVRDWNGIKIPCSEFLVGKPKQDCIWRGRENVEGRLESRNFHDSHCSLRDLCKGGNFTSPGTFAISYTEHDTRSNTDTTNVMTYTNVINSPPPCPLDMYYFCCEVIRKPHNQPC